MDTAATPSDLGQELAWHEANQRVVAAALDVLRAYIERHLGHADRVDEAARGYARAKDMLRRPSSLTVLQRRFGLSDFERDVVLLATYDQLDSDLAQLLPGGPSFNVALAAFPGAHWSALTPVRPLRAVPLLLPLGDDVVHGRLRLDERILHFLVGVPYLDERLRGLCVPVAPSDDLPGSLEDLAHQLRAMWLPRASPVQLVGDDAAAARAVVASACASAGLKLHRIDARDLPTSTGERLALVRLWSREAALLQSALVVEVPEGTAHEALHAALDVVQRVAFPAAIATMKPLEDADTVGLQRVDLPSPSVAERCQQLLRHCDVEDDEDVERAALDALGHFRLSHTASRLVGERVRAVLRQGASPGPVIWDACRRQVRARLGVLARCIEPEATWDDLVLPPAQLEMLRSLVAQVRQRDVVHRQWGFSRVGSRGLGTMALFWGSSGTGKTLATEVIAGELCVDLYHVDLSAVVSKYIGETEKNLSRIFDAAEVGGAVLLFDEADALFGKRSEVRDSHDRYANIEVSYLLQRMEAYRGLAILTSNIKDVMDSAFLRRIRMIVQFPFPDAQQREQLWRRMIPPGAPAEGLRFERLASLALSGGEIRNIALAAAFGAAEEGQPLGMRHIAAAARIELAKTDRVLRGSEIAGWT